MAPSPGKNRPPENRGLRDREKVNSRGYVAASCSPEPKPRANCDWVAAIVCGLLLLAVAVVFGQTVRHDFVNFDDNRYVYDNPQVTDGLTIHGIAWAFTQSHRCNWHPLTWMSHMLDCQLFGLWPGGHHLTNVLLHAAAAILLFLVLRQMTGRRWPSAFVAVLFAIHPVHVESVAWVAERKDVLSGLFLMLTLGAYCAYVRRPFSLLRYLAVVLLFALGLMAKPMLVTLPVVLLLLDFWPLRRFRSGIDGDVKPSSVRTLLIEKIPLAALAVGSCAVTLLVQGEAIAVGQRVSIPSRLANALVSYVAYLGQFFWPRGLAVFYPHPGDSLSAWAMGGAFVLLLGISAAAVLWSRRCPFLLVGWLWYLVMLLPVIGLVQVGEQAMADRYTYLTQIGLTISLVWGAAEVSRSWSGRRWACGAGSAIVLAALAACACRQTSRWLDRETLWTHALSCNPQNALAHNNLGAALISQGRAEEAIAHCRAALEIKPGYVHAYSNLGDAWLQNRQFDEAFVNYRKALELTPLDAAIHNNFGTGLAQAGRLDEAVAHYRQALKIVPGDGNTYNNLGNALCQQGKIDESIASFQKALETKPNDVRVHNNLGNALLLKGRADEATRHFEMALEVDPNNPEAQYNLGNVLAGKGRIDEAMARYRKAAASRPDYADAHQNLGVLLHQQGKITEALAQWREVIRLRPKDMVLLNAVARLLATHPDASVRNGPEAVELARRAVQLSGERDPALLDTLAAACAEAGRFAEAIEVAQHALLLASARGNTALSEAVGSRIKLYQSGSPFRDVRPSAGARTHKPQ